MLEDYADVFADIVNGLLFKGKQVINPDDLISTKARSQLKCDGEIHEQERDVTKFWEKGNTRIKIAFLGLENQTLQDADMPLRIMGYDGAAYKEQALNRPNTEPYPIVTLVLYFGEEPWTKARSLMERLDRNIPQELAPYVSDYKINVFEIAWLNETEVNYFKSDFRIVADFFRQKRLYRGKYTPPKDTIKYVDEVMKFLSAVLKDNQFEQAAKQLKEENRKGEGVTMCEIVQSIRNEGRAEGKAEGKAVGRAEVALMMVKDGLLSLAKASNILGIPISEVTRLGREMYPDFPTS